MSLGLTAVDPYAVGEDTHHVRWRFITAVSASTTGAAMSSVRPAPRSCKSTDVDDLLIAS